MMRSILLWVTLMLPLSGGCSPNEFRWREEIQLHDGRKIIAERLDVMGGWAELGQPSSPKKRTITFPDPNQPQKHYIHTVAGNSNYLLVDFEQGVPWLIVDVGTFSVDTKCPIGTYETFRWNGSDWDSVSYALLPKHFIRPNMLIGYEGEGTSDIRVSGKLLTAKEIKENLIFSQQEHWNESGWRLVQKDGHGRPIDCDYYRQMFINQGGGK